jgi:squalene-hopene/tetraprenyl-beta-curcumene cyclase
MKLEVDVERIGLAHKAVRAELLAERTHDSRWVGELAASPFCTAAAISALVLAHRSHAEDALRDANASDDEQILQQIVQSDLCELLLESVQWLARHQNPDGGWGDCVRGPSTIAATILVQAAFRLTGIPAKYSDLMARADQYVTSHGGVAALWRQFSNDEALIAAVMANAALADMVAWRQVPTLGFEAVCLPKRWQQRLPPPAAPQALPAFLAVGRAKFHYDPPRNPIMRLLRHSMRHTSVTVLERMQAADGSFSDSIPLTAFVATCLASIGCQDRPVVQRGIEFLLSSVQSDASWRVENNFAIWNTTLAVNQLVEDRPASSTNSDALVLLGSQLVPETTAVSASAWADTARIGEEIADTAVADSARPQHSDRESRRFADDELILDERCLEWLLASQRIGLDSATGIPPGGWGRCDSPGALPNALDTANVLMALVRWRRRFAELLTERTDRAAALGIGWLLDLQSDDGGWSTFSRGGTGASLYDSSIDVTALVLRALVAWQNQWQAETVDGRPRRHANLELGIDSGIERGWRYLESQQHEDGHFSPLWFGNEHHVQNENPVVGTSQVLIACADLLRLESDLAERAARWIATAQHANGGWGPPRAPLDYSGSYKDGFRAWRANDALAKFCSIEETALAVTALLPLVESSQSFSRAVSNGLTWLAGAVEQDAHRQGAVIGYSFARLWYHERLYPLVFAEGALARAARRLQAQRQSAVPIG